MCDNKLPFSGYRFSHVCEQHHSDDVTPEAIYENLLTLLGIQNELDREGKY